MHLPKWLIATAVVLVVALIGGLGAEHEVSWG
jgi:hypothetical protein